MEEQLDTNIFRVINSMAALRGYYKKYNAQALNWYKNEVSHLGDVGKMKLLGDNIMYQQSTPKVGSFCLYFYSPKYKEELPYYDTFPLVLVLPSEKNQIAGLNFHYLPPALRLQLLKSIIEIQGSNFSEAHKLSATYESIKTMTNLYKPTYHAYLQNHIKSRVVVIPPESVVPSVFLPVASFKKASQTKVWMDSRKKI